MPPARPRVPVDAPLAIGETLLTATGTRTLHPHARGALHLEFEFADGPTPTSVRATGDVDAEIIRCAEYAAAMWQSPRISPARG